MRSQPPRSVPEATRRLVEDMIHEAARAIDDDRLEEFPSFFTEDGVYEVASRFNVERGLPLAQINCIGRAMIVDRIESLRHANVFQPHRYRHLITGIHLAAGADHALSARSNFMIVRIMDEGSSSLFATGEYRDDIAIDGGAALFRKRQAIFDSRSIDTLLVIPI